eukprot:CAMPEP_0197678296 /NCGR_PEP_ID=MMETSP1338-20131121/89782_1 /TAXON_ID=43686 ORGANISM="Pelagodinium beii, Strain RCC1491" /NCGR_SAMPLE_ID=MMETSP1338 /ASSEMBLY_ACC=CAM_ASM_000754 /LENGTH=446 /DNA_ID=CAMNT_0043259223 /DNA_START=168 /DNA_END=1509 /DNA_ORIENTATION=+
MAWRHRTRRGGKGAADVSILSLLGKDEEEEDAWSGNDFEDELLRETEESRQRHAQALSGGRQRGHVPVLVKTCMDNLFRRENEDTGLGFLTRYDGLYVDATFGRGGYSREILSHLTEDGHVVAFDVDPTALEEGKSLEASDPRFTIIHRPFAEMDKLFAKNKKLKALLKKLGPPKGIVFDIGVSGPQTDNVDRGFSLQKLYEREETPLDLRMNPSVGRPASEVLQELTVPELAFILQKGNETQVPCHAERIAQAILDDQELNGPFESMRRFAEVAGKIQNEFDGVPEEDFRHPRHGFEHPARLTVQALRIFINDEFGQCKAGLEAAFELLPIGGRLVISVFKAAEQRILQQFVAHNMDADPKTVKRLKTKRRLVELYPLAGTDKEYSVRFVSKDIRPSAKEVSLNRRSRSGRTVVLEKIPRTCPRVKVKPRKLATRFTEPPPPELM